ncbi:MAG: dihydropteroate synthase [Pseudomonadota bacterium]
MTHSAIKTSAPFDPFTLRVANGNEIEIGPKGLLVGIVNVTPDSFSDGGQYLDQKKAVEHAFSMIEAGAAIVDIGGESTRPGADAVSAEVEQARILPVLQSLAGKCKALISVDTWRSETARVALDAGADIINDIWALQKDEMLGAVVAQHKCGVIAMHNGRDRNRDRNVIADQFSYFSRTLDLIDRHGIERDRVVLDPGFGFAKDPEENVELLARFEELHALGFPLLAGTSRKRFIGHYTGKDADNRDIGTAATAVVARMKGAALFRVHDVASNRDALAIADAVISAGTGLENVDLETAS